MPRTGSMGFRRWGLALTSNTLARQHLWAQKLTSSYSSLVGLSMRPSPTLPQACSPWPTSSGLAIDAIGLSQATLRWVAGWPTFRGFMAGATIKAARYPAGGPGLSRSSALPQKFDMKSALAGATRMASASRVRLMWAMLCCPRRRPDRHPGGFARSHCELNTGRRQSSVR